MRLGKQNPESKTERNLGLRLSTNSHKNRKSRRTFTRHQIAHSKQPLLPASHASQKRTNLMLTAEKIACPAAKAALGLGPLPEKISTGEMLCTLGLFANKEAAAKTMRMIPRIKEGSSKSIRCWASKRLSDGA